MDHKISMKLLSISATNHGDTIGHQVSFAGKTLEVSGGCFSKPRLMTRG